MTREVPPTARLYLAGKIDQLYVRQDNKGVVFLLNLDSTDKGHEMLEQLPRGQAHLMTFELVPLGPQLLPEFSYGEMKLLAVGAKYGIELVLPVRTIDFKTEDAMNARRQRRNAKLCRQKRHPLTKDNLIISKDGQPKCLACWWERKLNFIEAFNRSKAKGLTTASVKQLLVWSKKARRAAKIAESTMGAAALLAQQQDLRLFRAKRTFEEAQKRFEKVVQIVHEISEASKLKANSTHHARRPISRQA